MNDADDMHELVPSDLDLNRLQDLDPLEQGRVEAENGTWVALLYPVSPLKKKSWKWCRWSLLVNCPGSPARPAPYEFKTLKGMLAYLEQLESERVK